MATSVASYIQFHPRRAARAIAALLRDPDDLPQVFTVLESFSGTALWRLQRKFANTPEGARLMRERADIVPLLADRERLRALPEGSLGRAYLAFVEREGISPEGIRDASEKGFSAGRERTEEFEYVHQRMRDTHDLWHAAVGYQGDVLGESALLAFSLAQHWNTGIAVIVLSAILKGMSLGGTSVIADGWLRGARAKFLPVQEWETMLALPVEVVRLRLGLGPTPVYAPVRTAQLREAGVI